MRYIKNARVKFTKNGKTIFGTIVGRVMEGRKTLSVQVMDNQNKMWNIASAKELEKI
jgi:ClpP class serine protease